MADMTGLRQPPPFSTVVAAMTPADLLALRAAATRRFWPYTGMAALTALLAVGSAALSWVVAGAFAVIAVAIGVAAVWDRRELARALAVHQKVVASGHFLINEKSLGEQGHWYQLVVGASYFQLGREDADALLQLAQVIRPASFGVGRVLGLAGTVEYAEHGPFLLRVIRPDGTIAVGPPA